MKPSQNKRVPKVYISLEKYQKLQKDYEDFSYRVSHDLNAPLRHTREFSKILLNKLAAHIDSEDKEYANHITDSIIETEALLAGLVEYSRLSTVTQKFSKIDMNALLSKVELEINNKYKNSHIEINYKPLPAIVGSYPQIKLAFFHIIENAVKFCSEETKPSIQITAKQSGSFTVFSIKDNACSIALDYQDEVFSIFKQLSNDSNGIGLGLALVKKVIDIHDGKISINSKEGEGSTIHLRLPLRDSLPQRKPI